MMKQIVLVSVAVGFMAVGTASAATKCDPAMLKSLYEAERIVYSLRPDKAGQARVFAIDGTEYTGGQALWMKGQLRAADDACAHDDATRAANCLREVQKMLASHGSAI